MRHLLILAICFSAAGVIFTGCHKDDSAQTDQLAVQESTAATAPDSLADTVTSVPEQLPVIIPWKDPRYADWKHVSYKNVTVYYPEGHQHTDQMQETAQGYYTGILAVYSRMHLTPPEDSIRVYLYTGPGQGQDWTGRGYPWGDSLAVHYWPRYSRGMSLMQHLLYRIYGAWSPHPIMNHGLIALFDFAGENHHETTRDFLRTGEFIPLAKLDTDTAMNSSTERYQSAEAGSFVGFVMAEYGTAALESLYRSPAPFDSTVNAVFRMPVDSLQKKWIEFIESTVGPVDSTKQKS